VEACQQVDSIAAIRDVFRLHAEGQTILPDEAYLGWENQYSEHVRNLNMPAYVGGHVAMAGTKIINGNIANPTRNLPRASGLTLLYDATTGRVLCVMESAYISSLRTASVSLLAAQLVQGPPIESVAVIGAGVIAQMHIELMLKTLPQLQVLHLYDIDRQRLDQLCASLAPQLEERQIAYEIVKTPQQAIQPAQLIIPATTTTEGYIRYAWLQPGAIVVNVSLDDVLPEVVWQADTIVVDDWMLVKNDPRRLLGRMYRRGEVIGPDDPVPAGSAHYRRIDAQLGDLVLGTRQGRRSPQDIILINPFGLAIEDVAVASQVYRIARQSQLGVELPC
jgi:ornithine cyclodeaminase